jgi:excisionase family DNA binding protein
MAKDPNEPPRETQDLLLEELRARGMNEAEIAGALRKKKRRKPLEFAAVQSRRMMDHEANRPLNRPRFTGDLVTVEQAAQRLQLHPKTVLRFIREGRLAANRIGKSYRIQRADLDAFAGASPRALQDSPAEDLRVTAIVDIPGVEAEMARKWAMSVTNALNGRPRDGPAMRADVTYDPQTLALKIILVGGARDTSSLLALVQVWQEQLGL